LRHRRQGLGGGAPGAVVAPEQKALNPFGAEITPQGVRFRLWAPKAKRVDLQLGDELLPMQGENGWCERVEPRAFQWKEGWQGRPWREAVLYELHVGTFSPEGNYHGVIQKLNQLKETGITAIELMPLSDFAGRRNWGYDGVLPYAPDSAYGRPEDLK